jgi:polyisoprenoid-binding protein YceI
LQAQLSFLEAEMTGIRTSAGVALPATGSWVFDPSHSHLEFSVRHMMVGKTRGRFAVFTGTIVVAEEPANSSVKMEAETSSIDTRDEGRDTHLRSADFLDVEKHPKINFESTSVTGEGTSWTVVGDLTIKGVTKSVSVETVLEGLVDKDPWGNARVAFSGETEIDREDFGLTWNVALETGGVLVGKTVKISFEVEAVKQA